MNATTSPFADVVIIGAGPAGSVAASILALHHSVILVDRNRKPAAQIGENLVGAAWPVLVLQLQFLFEMRLSRRCLVGPSPARPSDNESRRDTLLRQTLRDAADFLNRPGYQFGRSVLVFAGLFFGIA